jgi:hypothetical protein
MTPSATSPFDDVQVRDGDTALGAAQPTASTMRHDGNSPRLYERPYRPVPAHPELSSGVEQPHHTAHHSRECRRAGTVVDRLPQAGAKGSQFKTCQPDR